MISRALVSLVFVLIAAAFSPAMAASQSHSIATPAPKTPVFKGNFDSSYYDFQGRHPADGNIYGFEGVNYRVQNLALTWLASPTWSFSLAAKHIRNYAETEFLGVLYEDKTQGMGDTKLSGTKTFIDTTGIYVVTLGLSLPTGSIGEKNVNNPAFNYPYNMQLGSGTFDIEPSLIYIKQMGSHQLGGLGWATLRNGKNEYGYRKGNEYLAKTWYGYSLNKYITPGLWFNYHHIQRLSGQDSTYGRNLFVEFYHSPRHFWDLTANVTGQVPITENLKIKGLLARPLWQESKNIDNVQVYMKWFAQLGIESTF